MSRTVKPIDRSRLRTGSASCSTSQVTVRDEAKCFGPDADLARFLAGLPNVPGASDIRADVADWEKSWSSEWTVHAGIGAHLIKVGPAPVLVDLMECGAGRRRAGKGD